MNFAPDEQSEKLANVRGELSVKRVSLGIFTLLANLLFCINNMLLTFKRYFMRL